MKTTIAVLVAALAALGLGLPSRALAVGTGNPVITSPSASDALYEGYTGPFVVNFDNAPIATYSYAVFRGDTATMVAGPYSYDWTGVGADPHLMVKALPADPALRFKITDHAGHEAQLTFEVRSGPAPRCALVVPARVRVNAPLLKVTGRLSSTCATLGTVTADWKVTHAGQVLDYYRFNGNTTDTWSLFDADPTGSYPIVALSARSGDNTEVPQNSPTVQVRRDSRLGLGGTRSGSYVTLRTTLSVYSASANEFRPWAGRTVALAFRSCSTCTWQLLRTLTTNEHGQASYRFAASKARDYRVTAGGTTTVWAALPKYTRS